MLTRRANAVHAAGVTDVKTDSLITQTAFDINYMNNFYACIGFIQWAVKQMKT